jgi:hypothetical protein
MATPHIPSCHRATLIGACALIGMLVAFVPNPSRSAGGDLPPGYPDLYVVSSDNPEPGEIFVTPFGFGAPPPPDHRGPLIIIDNQGMPLFYQSLEKGGLNFTPQQDKLTYWDYNREKFYVMDHFHAVVDSFVVGGGFPTDFHELQLLPNGHALIAGEDWRQVDMSKMIPGGNPNALVEGVVVQILDASKTVIFEWKSLDHIDILDADPNWVDFTAPIVKYFVFNAAEIDHDGHILVSGRSINQIVKVNSQTGDVIWRFGSNGANNSFTVVNDPRGFTGQHDIRRQPNGNVTLFDNGNWRDPLYSRALEFELDEVNMIATLVWEYRDDPDHFGRFMGGVQKRESGGTMIAWGGSQTHPKVTDLHADGTKAFELSFPHEPGFGFGTYRAFRAPWQTTRFVTDPDAIDFGPVRSGDTAVRSLAITNNWGSDVVITSFVTTDPAFYVPDAVPLTIPVAGTVDVDVVFEPGGEGPFQGSLYVRSVSDTTELVARRVELYGEGPVPVLLSGFKAESHGRAVIVSWFTSFEYLHEGFNVYRSSRLESGYAKLNRRLIRGRTPYSYLDKSVQPSSIYFYKLGAVDTDGHEVLHDPTSVTTPAWGVGTTLSLASPTPFRHETLLHFTLAAPARARLAVYDVTGRLVRTIIDGRPAGERRDVLRQAHGGRCHSHEKGGLPGQPIARPATARPGAPAGLRPTPRRQSCCGPVPC